MKRIAVLLLLTIAVSGLQLSAQSSETEHQVIVFAKDSGIASLPIEVTVNHNEVSILREGTYHSYRVSGSEAFIFVQPTDNLDKSRPCGYLASLQDASASPCYLQVSRPMLRGLLVLTRIDDAKARQLLASLNEQH